MSQINTGIRRLLALPAAYDLFQDLVGARALRLRWIRDCLKPFPGARILDIGCGTAEILPLLPEDVRYTGFDMSPAYIEAAKKRYGGRGTFTCETVVAFAPEVKDGSRASATSAEPDGGKFDIAMAFGVLHHLSDEESRKVFASARQALKPGGRMVTMDPSFVPKQSPFAHFLVSRDRGRNVRFPEAYAALAREAFSHIGVSTWHNALRMPYDHAILECRN
jgi:SAM-dependent methyltransferase